MLFMGITEPASALVIAECPPQCLGLACTTSTYDSGSIGIDQGTGVVALFYSKGILIALSFSPGSARCHYAAILSHTLFTSLPLHFKNSSQWKI